MKRYANGSARAPLPPDRYYIEDSLSALEDNLRFLVELAGRSKGDFVKNRESCYSAAYALMVCIEAVSGVAAHLIATTTTLKPAGMADSFKALYSEGILDSDQLVESLIEMSRFRNLIVHRYWKVDYGVVYGILQSHLSDFRKFAVEIGDYLDREKL